MKIKECVFVATFPEIKDMRERFFEVEELLDGFERPFNLVSLPKEAPGDLPRIVANTPERHSTLTISCQNAQLKTVFDDEFAFDVNKCFSYIKEKFDNVVSILGKMTTEKYYYFGVTTSIVLDTISPDSFINKHSFKVEGTPYDVSCRSTYIQDTYYINLELRNERRFAGVAKKGSNSLYGLEEISNEVVAKLDINDRYGFNSIDGYFAQKDDIETLINISKGWINNQLARMEV